MLHRIDRSKDEEFPFASPGIRSNMKLSPPAKSVKTEVMDIEDNSIIDDFTFIYGGKRISIGEFIHIAPVVSIM